MWGDDMLPESQFHHSHYHHCHLNYLLAAGAVAVAGAAFLSSFLSALFAGFTSDFLTSSTFLASALAGVDAAGAGVAGVAGVLAGSAAMAVNANADSTSAITVFMIFPFGYNRIKSVTNITH
jgi:hypothetical protein